MGPKLSPINRFIKKKFISFINPDHLVDSISVIYEKSRYTKTRAGISFCEEILEISDTHLIGFNNDSSMRLMNLVNEYPGRFTFFDDRFVKVFQCNRAEFDYRNDILCQIRENHPNNKHVNVFAFLKTWDRIRYLLFVIFTHNVLLRPKEINFYVFSPDPNTKIFSCHDTVNLNIEAAFFDLVDYEDIFDQKGHQMGSMYHLKISKITESASLFNLLEFGTIIKHFRYKGGVSLLECLEQIVPGILEAGIQMGIMPMDLVKHYHPQHLYLIYEMLKKSELYRFSPLEDIFSELRF